MSEGEAVAMMLDAAAEYVESPCQETFERFELACDVYTVSATGRVLESALPTPATESQACELQTGPQSG